jgi:hypothetical protein
MKEVAAASFIITGSLVVLVNLMAAWVAFGAVAGLIGAGILCWTMYSWFARMAGPVTFLGWMGWLTSSALVAVTPHAIMEFYVFKGKEVVSSAELGIGMMLLSLFCGLFFFIGTPVVVGLLYGGIGMVDRRTAP